MKCGDSAISSAYLTSVGLYLLNRWFIKPSHFGRSGFFNDVLCIPFLLPPVLWLHRGLGLRHHDRHPTAFELVFHWVVWSISFERSAQGSRRCSPRQSPTREMSWLTAP